MVVNNSPSCPFADEAALDAFLARPTPALIRTMAGLTGDLIILGVAGKMGVSLAMLARNAVQAAGSPARVIGVARFSEPGLRERLEAAGVETITADLLDPAAVAALPEAADVIYLVGRKFGTSGGGEALTWAMNALVPGHVARRYAGARIVALSTGCVYPMVRPDQGGCDEAVPPAPEGEYAMSALARERIFEHASRSAGVRICLVRLNYALDLRYGVIHDLAQQVIAGRPVDQHVPCFNGIWQGDANRMILQCLELCSAPASVVNLTGPEMLTVRQVVGQIGAALGRPVAFAGEPQARCWLNDGAMAIECFGYPQVPPRTAAAWTAGWLAAGGRSLGKPSHFQTTDGRF